MFDCNLGDYGRLSRAPIVYSIDGKLARKVKEVKVINPIPAEVFLEYNRWLSERLRK